ncbi:AAA family ATPase [Amaricoccus sp.]|uniref:AAA family ATPase n=1 Tax=Amaricoccus sp. TaxID=1872485 RepID=UPI001B60FCF2|nr:AAA family ATPase [Amaricoccus sp.]MBP7241679.1 AAA family ATPase [Amaricoccus sp.]
MLTSKSSRIVHPPLDEITRLRQPLTAGERAVLDLFIRKLPPDWEIYVQPHLNGLRPDFVLLNPKVGIGVFEVKDWDFNAMSYRNDFPQGADGRTKRPTLRASRDGKAFDVLPNPIQQLRRYKEEIHHLYCPRLEEKNGFAVITAGLIFPFASRDNVAALVAPHQTWEEREKYPRYSPISGREAISSGCVEEIFPENARQSSRYMTPDHADDLRGWLVEPDFSADQRKSLEMDARQRSLADTRTDSGYRRIKGPAGSGKSVVLAARAAKLAAEGKSVLIATYNITLWHYLRDLVARASGEPGWSNGITTLNFHEWCRRTCHEAGQRWSEEYSGLFANVPEKPDDPSLRKEWRREWQQAVDRILDVDVPDLASRAVGEPSVTRYDAILVDEGQDYRLDWWNALRRAVKEGGECVLIADSTQDVYGTAGAWTDSAMRGAGFSGGWAQLETSYRLPYDAMEMARIFAQEFLPQETTDLPKPEQGSLALHPCTLRWVQRDPATTATDSCVAEILSMLKRSGRDGHANADICLLTDDQYVGAEVIRLLGEKNIHFVSTFDERGMESKRKKMGFWMGDARLKATTIHSFKGWESRLLVVHITRAFTADACALIYAGLTRLKRSVQGSHLTVVCTAPELSEFGRQWPEQG